MVLLVQVFSHLSSQLRLLHVRNAKPCQLNSTNDIIYKIKTNQQSQYVTQFNNHSLSQQDMEISVTTTLYLSLQPLENGAHTFVLWGIWFDDSKCVLYREEVLQVSLCLLHRGTAMELVDWHVINGKLCTQTSQQPCKEMYNCTYNCVRVNQDSFWS